MSKVHYDPDSITTVVTIPIEAFQGDPQKPQLFELIKAPQMWRLVGDSLHLVDTLQPPISDSPLPDKPQTPVSPPKSLYKCPKCKEVFEKIAAYRKHMMWHRNAKKYKCDQCSEGYNVETNLKIHMAMHAEGRPTCPICGVSFQRWASLKSHLMVHHVEEFYTCEECGAEFDKEEELNKHLQNHLNSAVHESSNMVCSYCNVQFEERKSYKEHIAHHVKVRKMVLSGKRSRKSAGGKNNPHVCSVCLKAFSKLSLLERHIRVHSGERPFICPHCNKGFTQKGTLRIHLSSHTGEKPYQCTLCSAKFNQKGNLRVHVQKTHTAPLPGVKMYKCPNCNCIFKKIASLNVHIAKCHASSREETPDIAVVMDQLKELEGKGSEAAVTSYVKLAESFLDGSVRRYQVMQKKLNDTKWYICRFCDKEFKKPSDLIRHTRVHTREKPFQCKQCGASFSLKSTLYYHVTTHVNTNTYFCATCKKKFSSKRTFTMHLRRHADKQHKCLHCSKWFASVQRARLHEKEAHVDESPKQHQCHLCDAKFAKLPNLNRHLLHHGRKHNQAAKNFDCKVCAKRFATAALLRRHATTHDTAKPHVCPHCSKSFKSEPLCRKHMNVHKKEVVDAQKKSFVVQVQRQGDPVLAEKPEQFSASGDLLLPQDGVQSDTLEIGGLQLISQDDGAQIADINPIDQQLYEVPSTAIQVITQDDKPLSADSTQVQTILINCEDLQLGDNLYTQPADTMLFNPLDLQDNATFNIMDPVINNFIYNNEVVTEQKAEKAAKPKEPETVLPYYSQSELNLLLSLGPDNLPDINLNEVPVLNVEPPKENEPEPERQKLSCGKCNKIFTNKKTLARHAQSHREGNTHPCRHCEKVFKKNSDLVRHIRTHTGERPFACDKCEKRFSLKSTLLSHQRTHSAVIHKQFHCSVCNSYFSTKSSLKVHMTVHTGDKAHKCNYCPMRFRTSAHRKSHENNYHLDPTKNRKNKVTNLLESVAMDVLGQQEQLQFEGDHLVLNESTQLEPLIFQQLESGFIRLEDGTMFKLKTIDEEADEEKDRNFGCDVCGKKYTSKDVLRKHRKTHGLDKKYRCTKCQKGFDTEESFQLHEKTHEGLRPYSCLYCANSFAKEHNLATHMKRIHDFSLKDLLFCDQ